MTHNFTCRVYYEDTDLAGVVYYANYLKFIERARTEMVAELGFDQTTMKADTGMVFAVRRVEADYLLAAKFADDLTVATDVLAVTAARITLAQTVLRNAEILFLANVILVCLQENGRPARIPADIRAKMEQIRR
ncbi:MAG: tol-pal system-associated acyl-CoA thioesterase [Rhodobacterales bacterium]|jgi:acyl-CoA thioester hydrolase|nr:tol-pal system-associated acyl-CoA thioesterase [Pseudomonadota bacterium]MDA1285509.1 tol-pal system-associated acyl-CoA thioesterase [Pseudomonadota bacterium]NQW13461.1 tol-pal system-associated acyl-CoA thioesterase [Rhodobacter sp.]HBN32399.1 tol-pal system-associated acyl-CoA thioesterase [Paracoccaceae bacterium]